MEREYVVMKTEQERADLYVDAYGKEYRLIGNVEHKESGDEMLLVVPNLEGDVARYVVDKDYFERNFVRK